MSSKLESAVFGGGCFWCTEAVFQRLKGVVSVMPGYSGGTVPNPTYEQVCTGTTGHAEAIKIEFDPEKISYQVLLSVFFATHDPTTADRQGNDVGPQYHSSIFYMDERQRREAEEFIRHLEREKVFDDPIVTAVEPFKEFYGAEGYHKNYYNQNSSQAYCQVIINPKIQKLKEKFASLLV